MRKPASLTEKSYDTYGTHVREKAYSPRTGSLLSKDRKPTILLREKADCILVRSKPIISEKASDTLLREKVYSLKMESFLF